IFFIREKGVGQQVSLEMVSPDGEGNTSLSKTHKPERQPRSFAVSPNGRQIAYGVAIPEDAEFRREEVFLKAVDDDKPGERLKVQGSVWCWSPGGHSLAVTTLKDNVFSHAIVLC